MYLQLEAGELLLARRRPQLPEIAHRRERARQPNPPNFSQP